jgi:hypothetical protein
VEGLGSPVFHDTTQREDEGSEGVVAELSKEDARATASSAVCSQATQPVNTLDCLFEAQEGTHVAM